MPIYTPAIKPSTTLPKASPRACDVSLMHALIRDRSGLIGWAKAIEPRCRAIQLRVTRGSWQSGRELMQVQRQSIAIVRAAHAHRDLDRDVIIALDALQAFVAGIDMTGIADRSAA